jgi:outer membrane protein assembly factor BamB
VLLHPNVYYILKGTTGANLIARETLYWGMPMTGNFRNDGTVTVFFGTRSASATALFDVDRPKGTRLWVDGIAKGPRSVAAVGDFTGGGRMQAVGLGYPDGVRCYDTATGKVVWRMPMPADGVNDSPVSADIDSDGHDEVLFTRGHTLYCIGTDKTGKRGVVKWKLDLPAWVSAPVVADVDADGLADILVTGNDGNIYCVK